jgi:hypothetical protein
MMNEIIKIDPQPNADLRAYRASTEAADICKEIVVATSSNIQGKRYVAVEGWQAIAIAHGCALSASRVERVDGGVRAIGEVHRMSDGQLIATAEGFVGEDEPTWFGGQSRGRTLPKRADYAIRAMAQTRAMSRAGRTAFAHVVVMMNAGLATTPAEEMVTFDGETDEVIEPVKEPAAREKLDGPHDCKTKLRRAVIDIITQVRKVETLEGLEALKKEHKRTINQALRDWPSLVEGDPNIAEDLGLKGEIEKKKSELSVSTDFQFLASIVSECPTVADLTSFLDEYNDKIEALDGEESRKFEELYNAREEALKNPTPMTAGAFGA